MNDKNKKFSEYSFYWLVISSLIVVALWRYNFLDELTFVRLVGSMLCAGPGATCFLLVMDKMLPALLEYLHRISAVGYVLMFFGGWIGVICMHDMTTSSIVYSILASLVNAMIIIPLIRRIAYRKAESKSSSVPAL